MKYKKLNLALALSLTLLLSACIESEIQSFTDPDYKEAKFSKIILDTSSLSDDVRMEATKEIMKRMRDANYDVVDITQVILPTRSYSPEQIREAIKSSGYDNVLRFVVTSDKSKSEFAGFYNTGSTTAYGSGNNVYATSNSVAIPLTSHRGQTTTTAYVYDASNLRVCWQANISTKAEGSAFVGNIQAIASNVTGKVIDQWKIDGH